MSFLPAHASTHASAMYPTNTMELVEGLDRVVLWSDAYATTTRIVVFHTVWPEPSARAESISWQNFVTVVHGHMPWQALVSS